MRKTRVLFKKTGGLREIVHAKMGTVKNRNSKGLTEAEEIRRGGKNTQKNCTEKGLNDPDNHNGVITHLEPDILEYEVK